MFYSFILFNPNDNLETVICFCFAFTRFSQVGGQRLGVVLKITQLITDRNQTQSGSNLILDCVLF